jgi:hypothetical protein
MSDVSNAGASLLRGAALLFAVAALLVLGHLVFIEIGREVVTLRTQAHDGASSFLSSGGEDWSERFHGDPIVEVERRGEIRRYRAHATLVVRLDPI